MTENNSPKPSPSSSSSTVSSEATLLKITNDKCPVTSVRVFPDKTSEVTRTIHCGTLTKGDYDILLTDLTPFLDGDSVRISVNSLKITIFENTSEKKVIEEERKEEEIKVVETQIKEYKKRIEELLIELKSIKESEQWMESYASKSAQKNHCFRENNENHPLIAPEKAKKFLDSFLAKLESSDAKSREIEEEKKKINKELSFLYQKLKELGGKNRHYTNIKISLSVSEEIQNSELYVKYLTNGCSQWKACYDVRVDTQSSRLSLTYYGLITNWSDEDWRVISLSLSTTSPSLNAEPPSLKNPPTIYLTQRYNNNKTNKSKISNSRLENQSVQHSLSSIFDISRKCTILSDNETHKVIIAQIELQSTFVYTAAPSMTKECFLRALCYNTTPYVLIQGKMSVFIDNNFITSTNLESNNYPQEALFLNLGVDIGVQLKFVESSTKKLVGSGVFGKRQEIETVQRVFILDNHHTHPIHLFLFDSVPISREEKIQIKVLYPSDIPEPQDISDTSSNLSSLPISTTSLTSTTTTTTTTTIMSSGKENRLSKIMDTNSLNDIIKETSYNNNDNNSKKYSLIPPPQINEKENVGINYCYVNKTDQVVRWNISLLANSSVKIRFDHSIQMNEQTNTETLTRVLPTSIYTVHVKNDN